MKAADIRELSKEELIKTLSDKRKELFSLRIQARTGQLQNTASINAIRRDIARILTIQAEKGI